MQTLANCASTGLSGSLLALMNRHHGVVHPGLKSGCLPVPGLPCMNRWSRSGAEGGWGSTAGSGGFLRSPVVADKPICCASFYRWNLGWAFLAQIEDGVSWIATSTGGELEVPLEVGSVQDAFRRLLWTGAWEGFYGPAQLEALPSWLPQACVGRGCCVVLGPRYSWRLLVGSSRKQVSLWFWRTSTPTSLLEMFHGSAFHRPIPLERIRGPSWFLLWGQ